MKRKAQVAVMVGASVAALALFVMISRGEEAPEILPSEPDAPTPQTAVEASGGLPIDPTWYWGANSGIGGGDIYYQINPDVANFVGDNYTPLFGFVGFSAY